MMKEMMKAAREFEEMEGRIPETISMDYIKGVDLLIELVNSQNNLAKRKLINHLLDEGNRHKSIRFLNTCTVRGMKISISDVSL